MLNEIFAAQVLNISNVPFLRDRGITSDHFFIARDGLFNGRIHRESFNAPNWHPAFRSEIRAADNNVLGISKNWGLGYDRRFLFARADETPIEVIVSVDELNQNINTMQKIGFLSHSIAREMQSMRDIGFADDYWREYQSHFCAFASLIRRPADLTVGMESNNNFRPIGEPLVVDIRDLQDGMSKSFKSDFEIIKIFSSMMNHDFHDTYFDSTYWRWINIQLLDEHCFLLQLGGRRQTPEYQQQLKDIEDAVRGIVYQLGKQ